MLHYFRIGDSYIASSSPDVSGVDPETNKRIAEPVEISRVEYEAANARSNEAAERAIAAAIEAESKSNKDKAAK